jgi:TRAP-type C4-dicarboxylate transport system permease small subunit
MTFILAAINRVLSVCEHSFLVLANVFLALMLVGNLVNIVVRGIFDRGILLVFPWTLVLFVWLVFLGFFVVYRRSQDVSVTFLVDRLGGRMRHLANLFINLVVISMMGFFLWQAPRVLAMQQGIIGMIELPRFLLSIPFFTSCGLILLDAAWRFLGLIAGRESPFRGVGSS